MNHVTQLCKGTEHAVGYIHDHFLNMYLHQVLPELCMFCKAT